MAKCGICEKDVNRLYAAVFDRSVINICEECAKLEGIPIMKKPTQEQLARANQRYTVRERMLKISGLNPLNAISPAHEIAQRHLSKLKIPEKKQESSELIENYYWLIKVARRRKKITLSQLSQATGITVEVLDSIERGILVKNYVEIMLTLEKALGIRLLKNHEKSVKFIMPEKREQDTLQHVKDKMEGKETDLMFEKSSSQILEDEDAREIMRQEKEKQMQKSSTLEEIKKGEFNFTDKARLKNVTLSDLTAIKKQREREERQQAKQQRQDMIGDDLEM
jgi:ribosome-binding protein aMBF1 (putative translation factor)